MRGEARGLGDWLPANRKVRSIAPWPCAANSAGRTFLSLTATTCLDHMEHNIITIYVTN